MCCWPRTFRKNQRWVKAPTRLTYVDETRHLVFGDSPDEGSPRPHETLASPDYDGENASESSVSHAQKAAPSRVATALTPIEGHDGRYSPSNRIIFPRSDYLIPEGSPMVHQRTPSSSSQPQNSHIVSTRTPTSAGFSHLVPDSSSALPLESETEARLFRHYIQRLATCLDLCDPLRHFELVVPQRAGSCRTLLNAMFALAARHLSQTSDYDPLASNRYHDECLSSLIPMLNHESTVLDENLFAATIILRMLEEMDAPTMGQSYGHLLGIHAFVNVGDQHMVPGTLASASYWVGLRQEIYSAVSTQAPVKMNLDHFIVDRSFDAADDYIWSNRAVVNLADVINYCFSHVPPSSAQWASLNEKCTSWHDSRPPSFDPFYSKKRVAPQAFPEIWHHSSCHVIGIQHHILAQLFLAQFDPNVPRVGTKRGAAIKRMTQHIEHLMRQLCGIGASNQWTPPALFTASMGISMFGDQFEERADQEAMIDILRKTEENHARPTEAVQQQLMRAWGWIPDYDDNPHM
ncbi:uncharacterized protein BCR38DRAFT_145409 [Pseudomassariella vexata]|uniref:Fungal-specific transcription factor domain-domain-containing protein n=1 Tax=Pseudomassariella vexata TaxID=1141098 RepID=A0A1Y2D739_9PEZI|nr:uncharacterized protein BCR38DRAFT_145409 [Pseudomassariella vexata]ORY54974.1 hypothetical protein BCR38DRAFT_145409 [Pseudomassariella vexata]